jgi:hypothetical protein
MHKDSHIRSLYRLLIFLIRSLEVWSQIHQAVMSFVLQKDHMLEYCTEVWLKL